MIWESVTMCTLVKLVTSNFVAIDPVFTSFFRCFFWCFSWGFSWFFGWLSSATTIDILWPVTDLSIEKKVTLKKFKITILRIFHDSFPPLDFLQRKVLVIFRIITWAVLVWVSVTMSTLIETSTVIQTVHTIRTCALCCLLCRCGRCCCSCCGCRYNWSIVAINIGRPVAYLSIEKKSFWTELIFELDSICTLVICVTHCWMSRRFHYEQIRIGYPNRLSGYRPIREEKIILPMNTIFTDSTSSLWSTSS